MIPQLIAPQIVFEDTHLIILDKPAGLLSQGEHTGDPNLVDWLRDYLGRPYVGLIHRLDRNTSGLMIVAKRSKSAQRLTDQLQAGTLNRTYLAWLEGTLSPDTHRWRHFLRKDEIKNTVHVSAKPQPQAPQTKEALLTVRAIAHGRWHSHPLTLAEFTLETGRSHQIRAQSAFEGHPVLGDLKYGSEARPPFGRPALHSCRLKFEHPMTHEPLEYEAALPPDMAALSRDASKSNL